MMNVIKLIYNTNHHNNMLIIKNKDEKMND